MNARDDSEDEAQWCDERNWHLGHSIYSSRRDSRFVVPKWGKPPLSYTLNFGRTAARWAIALLVIPPLVFSVALAVFG